MKKINILSLLMTCCLFFACNQNQSAEQKKPASDAQNNLTPTNNLSNQGEEFEDIDFSKLNMEIAKSSDLTPIAIMNSFYPVKVENGEGNENITIDEALLVNGDREVRLLHENLLDDSVKSIKFIMHLRKQKNHWEIILLKKNWQCQEGRGDTNWGINPCT